MNIVNTVMHTWKLLKLDFIFSPHTKKIVKMWGDGHVNYYHGSDSIVSYHADAQWL